MTLYFNMSLDAHTSAIPVSTELFSSELY